MEITGFRVRTLKDYYPETDKLWPGGANITNAPANSGLKYRDFNTKSAKRVNPFDSTGWRSPSPYSRTTWVRRAFDGEYTWVTMYAQGFERREKFVGCADDLLFLPQIDERKPVVTSNMVNRAETECLLKLKDANVNYAVALAEARKTLGLIGGTLYDLAQAYKAGRKGQWKKASQILKIPGHKFKEPTGDVAKRWLELQYGWLPMLSDVHGMYEDMRKGFITAPRLSVKRVIRLPVQDFTVQHSNITFRYKHSKSFYGVKVRLDYQLNSQALSTASKMGLTNPALVAWELVPYSFVLDWAVPIGNWLEAFDTAVGLTFLGGTKTVFVNIHRKGRARLPRISKHMVFSDVKLDGSYDYFSMDRTVYSAAPIPLPYWKNPISTAHVTNALALLRGLLK